MGAAILILRHHGPPLEQVPLIQRTDQIHAARTLAIPKAILKGGVHGRQTGLVGAGRRGLVVLDLDALEHPRVVVGFVRGFAVAVVDRTGFVLAALRQALLAVDFLVGAQVVRLLVELRGRLELVLEVLGLAG